MYVNEPLHSGKKPKKRFRWWKLPLILIAVILVVAIAYVSYLFISYSRIEDSLSLEPQGTAKSAAVKPGKEYTALTYNVGFGAYTPDFSFFMDGGESSWAKSKESVVACINGAADIVEENGADFALFQEVDFGSIRSYQVDERDMLLERFPEQSSVFAVNFHSAFLCYPFTQPHGACNSGLLTFSESPITSATRRSLPIAESVKKFLDLDRCYSVSRIPTEDGKELILMNTHTSAYGTDGDLQTRQMKMLFDEMEGEYKKGNYVICGGDFNHDFPGDSRHELNSATPEDMDALAWCAEFPADMIPAGFSRVTDYAHPSVPSCRNADIPYSKDSFVVTVDGFIVSDNIEPTFVDVIDSGFAYSDHNPVKLKFKLKK